MKNLVMTLVLVLGMSSLAQADVSVSISGVDATSLIKTLVAAGAKETVIPDLATLNINNLSVSAGEFSSLTATQDISGPVDTGLVRLVNVKATGAKAAAVFEALQKAGVPAQIGVDLSEISASNISCQSGMVLATCTVTLN